MKKSFLVSLITLAAGSAFAAPAITCPVNLARAGTLEKPLVLEQVLVKSTPVDYVKGTGQCGAGNSRDKVFEIEVCSEQSNVSNVFTLNAKVSTSEDALTHAFAVIGIEKQKLEDIIIERSTSISFMEKMDAAGMKVREDGIVSDREVREGLKNGSLKTGDLVYSVISACQFSKK